MSPEEHALWLALIVVAAETRADERRLLAARRVIARSKLAGAA